MAKAPATRKTSKEPTKEQKVYAALEAWLRMQWPTMSSEMRKATDALVEVLRSE